MEKEGNRGKWGCAVECGEVRGGDVEGVRGCAVECGEVRGGDAV